MKVFVDTAPVMEKPLAEAAGLGWQGKHTNLVIARARLVAVPRRDLHHARAAAGRAGGRSLRHLPRLPRRLPDRRLSRRPTGSMRGAASPTSPSSTRGRSRASCAPLMGNRIYGCDDCLAVCPWNKFAQAGREAKLAARDDLARAAARRARAARRCGVPRAVRRLADQAHRARPLRAQRADRDRQFGRSRRSRPRPSGCSTMPRRWCAARRSGRWRRLDPAAARALLRGATRAQRDAIAVRAATEWSAA